jgi:hypothetical protein
MHMYIYVNVQMWPLHIPYCSKSLPLEIIAGGQNEFLGIYLNCRTLPWHFWSIFYVSPAPVTVLKIVLPGSIYTRTCSNIVHHRSLSAEWCLCTAVGVSLFAPAGRTAQCPSKCMRCCWPSSTPPAQQLKPFSTEQRTIIVVRAVQATTCTLLLLAGHQL